MAFEFWHCYVLVNHPFCIDIDIEQKIKSLD